MILDASFLISVDRSEKSAQAFLTAAARTDTALHTTHPVVAQVWRDGARQARLAAFLNVLSVHPLDDGPIVGRLLARSGTTDVVDAHLVTCAVRTGQGILTGDVEDIAPLAELFGPAAPAVHRWQLSTDIDSRTGWGVYAPAIEADGSIAGSLAADRIAVFSSASRLEASSIKLADPNRS